MTRRRNPVAKAVRSPRCRPRVVRIRTRYQRNPKHKAKRPTEGVAAGGPRRLKSQPIGRHEMTDATRMIAADLARDMDRTGPWPRSRRVENAVRREDHERAVRNKRIAARHGENGRTLQLVNVNPKAAA